MKNRIKFFVYWNDGPNDSCFRRFKTEKDARNFIKAELAFRGVKQIGTLNLLMGIEIPLKEEESKGVKK